MSINLDDWTYGAEHEWADWDYTTELPKGYGRDENDITIVNSNGIANCPKGSYYNRGGEINTPPTTSIHQQLRCLEELKTILPDAKVNYRSNLHLHIRVPGLKDDLALLKRLQTHIHQYMPKLLPVIDPLPMLLPKKAYSSEEAYKGAKKRIARNKASHHTLLKHDRLQNQLDARTVQQFFEREVPARKKDGAPQWQCQTRLCVNVRQLLETDTIEFRHFFGTMDRQELGNAFQFCAQYLMFALQGRAIDEDFIEMWTDRTLPKPLPYDHELETKYLLTKQGVKGRKENIERILNEQD